MLPFREILTSCIALIMLCSESVFGYSPFLTRRSWVSKANAAASSLIFGVAMTEQPPVANALEKRNEVLCGTGFFTNIAQYKCTDIGDISGDGKAKELSKDEESSVGSLMGKLGLDDSSSFVEEKGASENTQEERN